MNKLQLPSQYQIGDPIWLALWSHIQPAEIHGVYFTEGKELYDLNVFTRDGGTTRLYRIDPKHLCVKHPDHKPENETIKP